MHLDDVLVDLRLAAGREPAVWAADNTFTFVNNRLTARSVSLTENYAYGYDHFGNQTTDTKKVLLQADAVTTTGYNAASHTKRVTAPDGSWVEYNYDGLERLVSRQDSLGSTVMFFHDGLNDQIALETDPAGTARPVWRWSA